jgi:16S rRNA (cytosine967-C5)-methyltransferase
MTAPRSAARRQNAPSARALCWRALREWERGSSYSDEILHKAQSDAELSAVDRAFLTELFFGVLRHLRVLDFWIAQLRKGRLETEVRALLRLGLYQIFFTRVPAHAAVFETVSLAKGPSRGLLNGVLRRALREKQELEQALAVQPPAVRVSHPDFLWERWSQRLGGPAAGALCEGNNGASEIFFRVNLLRVTREELVASVYGRECGASLFEGHGSVLRIEKVPALWLEQGLGYVQDPSTLLAPDLLDPLPGECVWDACAAPGGKTTYLAQKMQDRGRIIACDVYASRVDRLRQNTARMGLHCVEVFQADSLLPAEEGQPWAGLLFDRILLDVPCSNTGVLRRRVDVRWRLTEEDFIRMPVIQFAFLQRAITALKPGGRLVYSTCSIEPEENEAVVERAQREIAGVRVREMRTLLPGRDGVDGAFAACLVRD